jgi:predicted transglutaminase-like cysteine proteinase
MIGSGVAKHRSFPMRSHHKHSGTTGRASRVLRFPKLRATQPFLLMVFAFLSEGLQSGPVRAQAMASVEVSALALPSGEEARPTLAWTQFCERLPDECAVNVSEPPSIHLTQAGWATLMSVNADVNTAIQPRTDQEHWGVEDRWDYPEDGYGDCEDYQILKRRVLAQAGLPRRAMRMTVVVDELGAGHAVLMVRTDHGEFVLDNKTDAVLPWSQTPYTYVKREGDANGDWVSLGGRTSPVATANR